PSVPAPGPLRGLCRWCADRFGKSGIIVGIPLLFTPQDISGIAMASAVDKRIKVGIVGGTGYTGVELLRLLSQHPNVELRAITSRKEDGMHVAEMYPSLRGRVDLKFQTPDSAGLEDCDVVFFATPHGVAMSQAEALLAAGVRIIDLAADFRLQDLSSFERWYKMQHICPE